MLPGRSAGAAGPLHDRDPAPAHGIRRPRPTLVDQGVNAISYAAAACREIIAGVEAIEPTHFIFVPCSTVGPVIAHFEQRPGITAFPVSREEDGVGIAAGLSLAGQRPVLLIQDTGLGNSLLSLTTFALAYHVPMLICVTRRGGLAEINSAVHHFAELAPAILDAAHLKAFRLDWRVPLQEWSSAISQAYEHAQATHRPVIVMWNNKGGSPVWNDVPEPIAGPAVAVSHKGGKPGGAGAPDVTRFGSPGATPPSRLDALRAIREQFDGQPLVSTCGATSRELALLGDRPEYLYVVDSMGLGPSVALGASLGMAPGLRRIVAIEGDGGLLMNPNPLSSAALLHPERFLLVVLDNGCYASTGGQRAPSQAVDLAALARGFGLPAAQAGDLPGLVEALRWAAARPGPAVVHARIAPGNEPGARYVLDDPAVRADRFARYLRDS